LLACFVLPSLTLQADIKETAKQIVGPWKLKMTTPDGETREPLMLIGRQHDQFVAWYVAGEKPEPMSAVALKNDTLTATTKPKEHPGITVKLEASLTGDGTCKGVGKYESENGEAGSWDFTGKRMANSSFDEVVKWQMEFVTPDSQKRTAIMTVFVKGSKLHAWYSGEDHELPVLEIKKEGNSGIMKMTTATRDGTKVDLVFRGSVEGEEVKGDIEYNVGGETGSFPYTAKRIE
jgi:hypothetical protein